MAKEIWVNMPEKKYKKNLQIAFMMGSEKILILVMNALVDELEKECPGPVMDRIRKVLGTSISAKTYERIEEAITGDLTNEEFIRQIADTFNRYCQYMDTDVVKTAVFVKNFEKWTGMQIQWNEATKATAANVDKAFREKYFKGLMS